MFAVGFNPHFSWFPIILNFQKIFWSEFVLFYRPVGRKGGTDYFYCYFKKYEFSIFFKKLAHFYPSFRKEKPLAFKEMPSKHVLSKNKFLKLPQPKVCQVAKESSTK